jgi:hypothetical protein
MRKLQLPLAFLALLLLPGCSPRDFLTRRLAFDLIAQSPTFRTVQRFELHTGVVSNDDYLAPESLALLHHGWITASQAPCPAEIAPPPCWDLALTPSGVETLQPFVPASEAEKKSFTLLAARRELLAVTGISAQGNNAEVEFLWRWSPLNEVGAALYHPDQHFRSTAALRRFDDGWRLVHGTPRPTQTLEDSLKSPEPVQ